MADFIGIAVLPHNDIEFVGNSLRMATDAEAIGQLARQRLMCWQGEWFLNENAGVDWKFYLFDRRPSEKAIGDAAVKACVLGTPGVSDIIEYQSTYSRQNRGLIVDRIVVQTPYGELNFSG